MGQCPALPHLRWALWGGGGGGGVGGVREDDVEEGFSPFFFDLPSPSQRGLVVSSLQETLVVSPLSAELDPEAVGNLPLHGFCDTVLRPEVVCCAVYLPVGRSNGVYPQLLDRLRYQVDGTGPGHRLQAVFPIPLGYLVGVSVFRPMADESAGPADRRFVPALGGVQQEGQSGVCVCTFLPWPRP